MHVMPTDDVFFIVNAKPNDMGVYSCTANNAAGTIVANATLIIEGSTVCPNSNCTLMYIFQFKNCHLLSNLWTIKK